MVIEKAVSCTDIDCLLEDVALAWDGKISNLWIETFLDGNRLITPIEKKFQSQKVKLLDLYSQSVAALRISLNAKIMHFLELIFERPPLAFQSLSFMWGSEQPMHQDTAYVKVNSPMELVASWVALEDIQAGTGELEYYVGSHRLPEYLWKGNSKWMLEESEIEHAQYLSYLHHQAELLGLKRSRFLGKKGDVLIWSNDLAHGGSKVEDINNSRQSLVTHYCPINCNPYYFYYNEHSGKIKFKDCAYYSYQFRD